MLHPKHVGKACIFCNEPLTLNRVAWLIEEAPLRRMSLGKKEEDDERSPFEQTDSALWDAIYRFHHPDPRGESFFQTMGGNLDLAGKLDTGEIRCVFPEDFDPAQPEEKSVNTYTTPSNNNIPIFKRPGVETDGPYLCFTEEFSEEMRACGLAAFQTRTTQRFIEEVCIRPVCPKCMSYIPKEQLDGSAQDTYVVRLAYIGQMESGKTTLNWANLICDTFDQNGWTSSRKDVFSSTHYKAENFYEDIIRRGVLPERTPKNKYTPPLLIRLRRNNKTLLLVLMDIAGELLQQIQIYSARRLEDLQTFAYLDILKQMDGFLLMLDVEKEILPLIGIEQRHPSKTEEGAGKTEAGESQADEAKDANAEDTKTESGDAVPKTLYELLKGCVEIDEFKKKPAALLLTKCDLLFDSQDNAGLGHKYDQLFHMFASVERKFWQQSNASPEQRLHYDADYHECIQIPFRAFIQHWFPQLWGTLQNTFSRVSIFPESSLGAEATSLPPSGIQKTDLHPFHSADPIFWMLDVVALSDQEDA